MEEIIESIYEEAHYCRFKKRCSECDRYVDNKCTWVHPPDEDEESNDSISKSMIKWVIDTYKNLDEN